MKTKFVIGAVVLVGVGIVLVLKYQALTKEREQNRALQQQVEQLTRQAEARPRPSNLVAPADPSASLGQKQLQELNKLRREVAAQRPQTNELDKLRAENRQLRAATDEPDDPAEAEFKKETRSRNNNLKMWGLDFHVYASKHNDQFPESWEEVLSVSQKRSGTKNDAEFESYMSFLTNSFEIVYRGTTGGITKPGETILFREKQARRSPKGEWVKVYGFADGSTQIHTEPAEGNFEAWEQPRMVGTR